MEYENVRHLVSSFNIEDGIHHLAFITSKKCSDEWFSKNMEKYIYHLKLDAYIGFIKEKNTIIEFIRPCSKTSLLKKDFECNYFKFDHICYFKDYDKFDGKNKIRITKKFYTELFETNVEFFLIDNKKVEIIDENCK